MTALRSPSDDDRPTPPQSSDTWRMTEQSPGNPASVPAKPSDSAVQPMAQTSSADEQPDLQPQSAQVDLQAELERLRQLHGQVKGEAYSLRSQLSAALADARRDSEVLLGKLHESHRELYRYYLEWRAGQTMPPALAYPGGPRLRAVGVRPTSAHETGPHRHLDLELQDVTLGGTRRPDLRVRLVEHAGRPGLALFQDSQEESLLSAWRAGGQEAGQTFMLVVPSDSSCQGLLAHLGRTDWRVLCDLAGLACRGAAEAPPAQARWRGVAARLVDQLAALPPRLRYDQAELAEADGRAQVRFRQAAFGPREFESLQLQLDPKGTLALLADDAAGLWPLAAWPVDESGSPVPHWQVPVGPDQPSRAKRMQWAALTASDRELVLALLDALPGVAEQAAQPTASRLAPAALALHRDARRQLDIMAGRQQLRRLLGRLARSWR
jgi:hypothetical protein